MDVLELRGLTLEVPRRCLIKDAELTVRPGECVAMVGPSGAGKTSLLNCAAGISDPSSGTVVVNGAELHSLNAQKRSALRLKNIGMVFQFGELLPELTAAENVALPLRLLGMTRREAEDRAMSWLERFGLLQHAESHPDSLSGGEVQRIGIARALAHSPVLVLADEPTGMLDEENTQRVIILLVEAAKEERAGLVMVTHDPAVASAADRVLGIQDRRLIPVDRAPRAANPRP